MRQSEVFKSGHNLVHVYAVTVPWDPAPTALFSKALTGKRNIGQTQTQAGPTWLGCFQQAIFTPGTQGAKDATLPVYKRGPLKVH